MDKSVIEVLLQYGGLGAVLIIVGVAYFKKDLALIAAGIRLQEEQQRRIDDGKAHAIALQAEQQRRIDDGKVHANALQAEQEARIADAKGFHALSMTLQELTITAVNKLSDIVEVFEKREAARELRDEMRDERRKST